MDEPAERQYEMDPYFTGNDYNPKTDNVGPTCERCGKPCLYDLCRNCRDDEADERGY